MHSSYSWRGFDCPPKDLMADFPSSRSVAFAERYVVERELGRGGTAIVYLARDLHRSRHVAVKVLRPELAEATVAARFLREIKTTAGLQHPLIVPVLDSGEVDGRLYFVLPYMDAVHCASASRSTRSCRSTRRSISRSPSR